MRLVITAARAYPTVIAHHGPMDDVEPLLRYWRAQDDVFERVDPFWWGAVVSDARFPHVQEANYARVETRERLRLAEVEEPLVPAMQRTAHARTHVVVFFPEDQTDLLAEASTRGDKLAWDLVMQHMGVPPAVDDVVVDELVTMERSVMVPGGRRWFVVRHDGEAVAFAGLAVLEGVGYLDNVVTFPQARRRGYATALAAAAVEAARASGAERTYLMADPTGT